MKTKYFLYARKSTEDEERQVMSIEAQLFELTEYARREKIEINEKFIESKSAKKPGREIFNQMIEKIHQSKEPVAIIAWHPDRLARNSVDGGQIIYLIDTQKIISLHFPTFWFEPTPQGLFMLQVAFGQSKYYSDNLSENVKRGIRQKLRRGEFPGLAPLGYINNPKTRNIEPDPVKSKIVKKAFDEFAEGKHTLESLSLRLSFWGVVSRSGKPFVKSTVKGILTNPAYIGLMFHKGEAFEAKFSPLISKSTFETVQRLLNTKSRPRKSKKRHDFPFVGLMKCGECGSGISAQYAKQMKYRYYRCTKKAGEKCSQSYLREDLLINQFREQLKEIAIPKDWSEKMLSKVRDWEKQEGENLASSLVDLETKVEETDMRLDKLVNSLLDGTIDKDIYLVKKEELIKTKTELLQKKSELTKKGHLWIEPLKDFIFSAHHAEKLVSSNDLHEIKSFIQKVGTNRTMLDKKVIWVWAEPFEKIPVVKRKFQGGAPKNPVETTAGSKEEKEESCIWSG